MVLILLAICVGECIAQSNRSVSQTVSFGVRRIEAPSIAANLSQVNSDGESTTVNPASLKIAVGSDVSSDEYAPSGRTSVVKKTSQLIAVRQSLRSLRTPSAKSVVTVTE